MAPDDEEFDLMIILLKKLCVKGCKKGVTKAAPKDDFQILCGRFTWGMVSSLLTLIIAITGKCRFFTDVTDKDSTSLLMILDKRTLADFDVCNSSSTFHGTSSPMKKITESLFKTEESHTAPKNITATLDGNVPFTFLTISFLFAILIIICMFFGYMIGKWCGRKVRSKFMGFLRYPYKAMSMSISVFILVYNCITFGKVDQNIASITTLVLSILSLIFAIVMIIRYIYITHCKKKTDSGPESYGLQSVHGDR